MTTLVFYVGMIQLTKSHKAEYLKDEILNCLALYDIELKQIYSSTTDNGKNMLKASRILQELQKETILEEEIFEEAASSDSFLEEDDTDNDCEYDEEDILPEIDDALTGMLSVVRCAAHTIQLAANDVINMSKQDVKIVRHEVTNIRSQVRSGKLNVAMPVLDNETRWNSTFNMIKSLVAIKDKIKNKKNISVNWTFVETFVSAFKPLADCTLKFQTEQYVIGDFYRDWLSCEIELEELIPQNSFASDLHARMAIRKTDLLQHNSFVAALYLDPRFNFSGSPILSNDQKQTAIVSNI